jgi:hypothetical protein
MIFILLQNKHKFQKKIKFFVTEACAEFCALDGRAFDVMKGVGFQNLAQVLFNAGRNTGRSSIEIKDILPHPTTVRMLQACC